MRDEREELNDWREASGLFKRRLYILVTERRRDKRAERVYKAAGGSVKNRQLHRQKQDAESIHLLKGKAGGESGQTVREKTAGVDGGY